MQMNAYLTFDGTCEAALTAYAAILGGEIRDLQRFGEMPDTSWVTPDNANRIAHAKLRIGDRDLMVSDTPGHAPFDGHNGFSIQLDIASVAEGRATFEKLADGGSVVMPFETTFWAAGFGMCRDRFGVPWMVNVAAPSAE